MIVVAEVIVVAELTIVAEVSYLVWLKGDYCD